MCNWWLKLRPIGVPTIKEKKKRLLSLLFRYHLMIGHTFIILVPDWYGIWIPTVTLKNSEIWWEILFHFFKRIFVVVHNKAKWQSYFDIKIPLWLSLSWTISTKYNINLTEENKLADWACQLGFSFSNKRLAWTTQIALCWGHSTKSSCLHSCGC